jgi:hypothetical protein
VEAENFGGRTGRRVDEKERHKGKGIRHKAMLLNPLRDHMFGVPGKGGHRPSPGGSFAMAGESNGIGKKILKVNE